MPRTPSATPARRVTEAEAEIGPSRHFLHVLHRLNRIGKWTFITNHARVLLVISRDPTVRLRDIATTLDITERAAQRIVTELVEAGFLTRKREGRRNTYKVHHKRAMRAPQAQETEVGEILNVLLGNQDPLEPKD